MKDNLSKNQARCTCGTKTGEPCPRHNPEAYTLHAKHRKSLR